MCNLECALELLSLCIVLISYPIYILFLCVIYKHRHSAPFNTAFYCILRALGVVDLVTISHWYIFNRSLYWNFTRFHLWGGGPLVRYYTFVIFGGQRCQQLMVLVASINRYVSIVRPTQETIWTVQYTGRAALLCVLISFGSYLPIPLVCSMRLIRHGNGSRMRPGWPWACWTYAMSTTLLLSAALSVILIVLYVHMFCVAWRRAKQQPNNGSRSQQTKERAKRNLAVVGGVLSGLVVATTLHIGVAGVFRDHYQTHIDVHLALVSLECALFTMCNPWLVLACAHKARHEFLVFIRIKKRGASAGNKKESKRDEKE